MTPRLRPHSSSAASLLLVLVLILMRPDIREIRATYGQAEVFISTAAALKGVQAVAESPEQLEQGVGEIQKELVATASAELQMAEVEAPKGLASWLYLDPPWGKNWSSDLSLTRRSPLATTYNVGEPIYFANTEALSPQTSHALLNDEVRLQIDLGENWTVALKCTVTDPTGDSYTCFVAKFAAGTHSLINSFSKIYPSDFPGAPPLVQGTYSVEWARVGTVGTFITGPAGGSEGTPIASDSFTIDEPSTAHRSES